MKPLWPLVALLFLGSCGVFLSLGKDRESKQDRILASEAMQRLTLGDGDSLSLEIDEQLAALHAYYVISQKELSRFEEAIPEKSLPELFKSSPYLSLLAARTQIDDIEFDIVEASKVMVAKKRLLLERRIKEFSAKGPVYKGSVENLKELLGLSREENSGNLSLKEALNEYAELEKTIEFQIFVKNVEHLYYMMETSLQDEERRKDQGDNQLTGQEFPEKVWSLTFSNGPVEETTLQILQELEKRKLKATFFLLQSRLLQNTTQGNALKNAGMEIGSQGKRPKELGKAGMITLEREITGATDSIEKSLKTKVTFYRLPYGSGRDVPVVKDLLAKNRLTNVFWNIDSLDWIPQSPDRIVKRTKDLMSKSTRDAGIILFHDVHARSIEASARIMDHLQENSRRVCTLGKIVDDLKNGKQVCSNN